MNDDVGSSEKTQQVFPAALSLKLTEKPQHQKEIHQLAHERSKLMARSLPSQTEQLKLRISPELMNAIDSLVDPVRGVNRSDVARNLLAAALSNTRQK